MGEDIGRERVVHRVLERQAEKYGDRTFFFFGDKEFSYNEFNSQAGRVACGLQRLGFAKGDKAAIIFDNSPEFLFLWFGLSKLGAIEVPINTAHKGDILSYMLDTADSRILVAHSHYLDRVEAVLARTPKIETVVVCDGQGAADVGAREREHFREEILRLGKRVMSWEDLVDNDGGYQPADVLWSDPFIIMFTSGTTGPSKGSVMPHNYPIHLSEMFTEVAGYTEKDRIYNALPLFHGNAQLCSMMPALYSGAQMVLIERFSASRFWEEVKRYGCTEFNGIGGLLPIMYKAEPKPDDADNPLRLILNAATPKDLIEPFEKRFGLTILEVYGMSEVGMPLMSSFSERRPGSTGKPFRDYSAKIVDDNGLEVGPNTPGELLIRPLKPYSMLLEYYKMPEKTVEAWRDLWFHTGDYLYRDDDGFFFFVDRKKDALRRRGENISSFELESTINSHPAVLESAAIAVKSELGEDEVMVCVVLKPGQSLTSLEFIQFCEPRMAYFMVPRYVRFLEALPKTPTARIEKYRLREEGVTPDTWDRDKAGYKVKR